MSSEQRLAGASRDPHRHKRGKALQHRGGSNAASVFIVFIATLSTCQESIAHFLAPYPLSCSLSELYNRIKMPGDLQSLSLLLPTISLGMPRWIRNYGMA